MNCTEIREKLVEYIEGILPDEQKQLVQSHLNSCSQCRAELNELNVLGKRITSDAESKQSANFENVVFNRIIREQNKRLKQADGISRQLQIWRIIMKSSITKLAVAAVLVIAAVISITLLNKSATPAYAIEQTIEAMRSIRSIHAFCTDWDNSKEECWVQTNPETGEEEYYYADQGNLLIVGTPQATYYYYKDKNLVRVRNEYVPASEVRFSRFFEDLVVWTQQHQGELRFYSKFVEDLRKEVIMIRGFIPTQGVIQEKEFIFRVDPQTKLPISMEMLKCGPGQGVKSVDSLEYNVPIPAGIFEFKIPAGAKVVYGE